MPNGGAGTGQQADCGDRRTARPATCASTCTAVRAATNEYCVICHNPGDDRPGLRRDLVDLAYMAHSIHRGETRDQALRRVWLHRREIRRRRGHLSAADRCSARPATSSPPSTPQGDDWQSNPSAAASAAAATTHGLNKTGPSVDHRPLHLRLHALSTSAAGLHGRRRHAAPAATRADGAAGASPRHAPEAGLRPGNRNVRFEDERGREFTLRDPERRRTPSAGQAPTVTFRIRGTGVPAVERRRAITATEPAVAWASPGRPPDIHNVADAAGDGVLAGQPWRRATGDRPDRQQGQRSSTIGDGSLQLHARASVLPAGVDDATSSARA
ncbi:MAG: hypothetical protein MZV65_31330 [Chromatiales bacterium]|nr:hypothetical protein [Chromatiales bacterium]